MTRERFGQLLRFSITGVLVAGLYVGSYVVFLAAGLAQVWANAAAFGTAVTVQYIMQTAWTFRKPLALPDQAFRFICTIALGYLVSAVITGFAGPLAGWPDWLCAAVVAVVLPVQNFIIFSLWVYTGPSR